MQFTLYTTHWCGDCFRTKQWLQGHGFVAGKDFEEVDIEADVQAARTVEEANNGDRSVPTLIFKDGSILIEPSPIELAQKLQVNR